MRVGVMLRRTLGSWSKRTDGQTDCRSSIDLMLSQAGSVTGVMSGEERPEESRTDWQEELPSVAGRRGPLMSISLCGRPRIREYEIWMKIMVGGVGGYA